MILQATDCAPITDATADLAEQLAIELPMCKEVRAEVSMLGSVIFQALGVDTYRVVRFNNQGKAFDRTYGAKDTAAGVFADQIALLG